METIIQKLDYKKNNIFIKREDLFPFSFGGNKFRKAMKFFLEIDEGNYDCIVTYGSSSSNHARVVANMAKKRDLDCYIISPTEASEETFNSLIMKELGANITIVNVEQVSETIKTTIENLEKQGKIPYFIPGGGHGILGTKAYVECFNEILSYEKYNNLKFDYIFLASGTGATQAGLICGNIEANRDIKIIGISIARKNPQGREVIIDSVSEYFDNTNRKIDKNLIDSITNFYDDYICGGYAKSNEDIKYLIDFFMNKYGIPLDPTYTAKAFMGMQKYIDEKEIENKNILFIHTGGTPLYFDYINKKEK